MSDIWEQGPGRSRSDSESMIVPAGQSGPGNQCFPSAVGFAGFPVEGGGRQAAAQGPLSIQKLLRQKWLMLAVFVLVVGGVIPLIWTFVEPEYSSTALIRVASKAPSVLYPGVHDREFTRYEVYLNSQVTEIRRAGVLNRVLDQEDIQATAWYQERPFVLLGDPPSPLERLSKALNVRPRRGTELIDVTMTTKRPREAQQIVAAVVGQYWKDSDGETRRSAQKRIEELRDQLQVAQQKIDGAIDERYSMAERFGSALPEDFGAQLTRELHALKSRQAHLRMDQHVLAYEIKKRKGLSGGSDPPVGAESESESEPEDDSDEEEVPTGVRYALDPKWVQRSEDHEDARHQLELARQTLGDEHPRIKVLIANVSHAEELLGKREEELEEGPVTDVARAGAPGGRTIALGVAELQFRHDLGAERARQLESEIEDVTKRVTDVGRLARDLAKKKEELALRKNHRNALRAAIQQLETEGKSPGRISIASPGLVSTRPKRDRRFLLTFLALGAAFMAAAGVGYLRSSADSRIYEVADVATVTPSPFLGQLPQINGDLDLSNGAAMDHALEESIRMVRTTLLRRMAGSNGAVVAVTSAVPDAGKTTFSVLLARSLQQLGKKVLLVDADFRQSSLSSMLNTQDQGGLIELLTARCTQEDAVIHAKASEYHVLPAGQWQEHKDSEVLANGVMSACITRWKKDYDFVIMDGPPILSVADGRILAGQADGAIMVLKASHCTRTDAMEAYAGLSAAGAKLLGTVLVGTRQRSVYYANGYGRTSHQEPDEVPL